MNWITIGNVHINLDLVQGFFWENGVLGVGELELGLDRFDDPDKVWYHKLCSRVGLPPVEKEDEPHV